MSIKTTKEDVSIALDELLQAMYNIVKSNRKRGKVMTKAQEELKKDIEKIEDDITIEKVRIFIMGILAQQNIAEKQGGSSKELR